MGMSAMELVFFEFIYLFILFLHICMFSACCFRQIPIYGPRSC